MEKEIGQAGQKRHLTILFSDLNQSTKLVHALDKEDVADLVHRIQTTFKQVIPKHGGNVSQVQGDGVYAIFGVDYREDAGRKAVEAALELHETIKTLDLSELDIEGHLTMHSGIHSGLSHVSKGDDLVGQFSVVADAVNIAHRLSAVARPDEILVSEFSLGSDSNLFDVSEFRHLKLDGIEEPIATFCVTGRASIPSRFHSRVLRSVDMVGRRPEMDQLHRAHQSCLTGLPQSITIVAPPGAGKTRLVEEFLKEIDPQEALIIRGYCEALRNTVPMQPVLQMCCQLLQIQFQLPDWVFSANAEKLVRERLTNLAAGLEKYSVDLTQLLQSGSSTGEIKYNEILDKFVEVLGVLSRKRTLVLFIDDWQWADDLTRSIVRSIKSLREVKILHLQTTREESNPSRQPRESTIRLEPLNSEDSSLLARNLLPQASQFVIRQIRDHSGGNPLYLEELCHAARQGRTLPTETQGASEVEIYNNLHILIESRVAQLPPPMREIVGGLAILGDDVPWWLFQAAMVVDNLTEQMAHLAKLDLAFLTESESMVKFKHGVTRDVVYATTTRKMRRDLHERAIAAIELRFGEESRDAVLERLAYHSAGTTEYTRTADYAEAAGNKAFETAALDRARTHYERALSALQNTRKNILNITQQEHLCGQWMRILKRYAQACLFDAQPEQRLYFERGADMARQLKLKKDIVDTEYWLAYLNYTLGYQKDALRHIQQATLANEHSDRPAMAIQLRATWGQIKVMMCEHGEALTALNDALDRQRAYKHSQNLRHTYGYTLAARAMALAERGDFKAAESSFDEAEEIMKGRVHQVQASICTMRAGALLWQGDWERALNQASRGIELAEHLGSRYILASSEGLAGYAQWQLGQDGAEQTFTRAMTAIRAGNQVLWTSMHFSWYAELLYALQRFDKAKHALAWALQRSRQGERLGEAVAYCVLAVLPSSSNSQSEDYFATARQCAEERSSAREAALVDLKHLEWSLKNEKDIPDASDTASNLQNRFSSLNMPYYTARAGRLPVL